MVIECSVKLCRIFFDELTPVNFKRNIRFRGADLLHELKHSRKYARHHWIYIRFLTGLANCFFQVNGGLCRTYALAVRLFITDF